MYAAQTYNQMPAGSIENFLVNYDTGPNTFYFYWNESASSAPANFVPLAIENFGEVQDWASCSPVDCGSQAVGDIYDSVNVTNVGYTLSNGQTYNASLNYNSSFPRTSDQALASYGGNTWSTWDKRCNS